MASAPAILFVKGNYGRAAGPETLLATILERLDRGRFRPTLVRLERPGFPWAAGLDGRLAAADERRIMWGGLASAPAAGRSLGGICAELRAALIHTHDMRSNLAVSLMPRRAIPWMAHIHGWLGPTHAARFKLYERIDQHLARRADLVVVGSEAARRAAEEAGIRRLEVVTNAVDLPAAEPPAAAVAGVRASLGAGRETLVAGVLGRLHPGKGQRLFVRAVAHLLAQGLDLRGLVVGEGPDRERLDRLRRELGVEREVVLAGFQPDPDPWLGAMDVFVAPSLHESLPLVVLEAMGRGRAVIAARVGDLPRVIEDGRNGLLVPPGDVAALAGALAALHADPALRRAMGERARADVIARYSPAAMVGRLEGLYNGLLAPGWRPHA